MAADPDTEFELVARAAGQAQRHAKVALMPPPPI